MSNRRTNCDSHNSHDSALATLIDHFGNPHYGETRVELHTEYIWVLYVCFVSVSERQMFRFVVTFFDQDGEPIQRLESPFRYHNERAAKRAGRELELKIMRPR